VRVCGHQRVKKCKFRPTSQNSCTLPPCIHTRNYLFTHTRTAVHGLTVNDIEGAASSAAEGGERGGHGEAEGEGAIVHTRSDESVGKAMTAMEVRSDVGSPEREHASAHHSKGDATADDAWEDPPDKIGDRAAAAVAVAESAASKKDFANARKKHYNMKEAMMRARQLLDEEEDDDDD
jgi:hypothetical protein